MFFSKLRAPAEVQGHERRRSIRHATVSQIAKLRLGSGQEELCLLCDISPEGLKAEIYVPAERGMHVEIEVRTGHSIGGRIVWAQGGQIGVSFDEPIPMSAIMAHCSFDDRVSTLRPPRLNVNMRGLLRVGREDQVVEIGNISQAGAQIAAEEPLESGTPCAIALPGLAHRRATIRWWRERQAGLMLDDPFDYAEFADWRSMVAA